MQEEDLLEVLRSWTVPDVSQVVDDNFSGAGSAQRIFALLTSSRWRRSKLSVLSERDSWEKIDAAVSAGRSIELTVPFGGYKLWRVESSPMPDWAELFSLNHLWCYAVRIARIWPPGVTVSFSYCSGIMDVVSNQPLEWQEAYIDAFRKLLPMYSNEGVTFKVVDIAELYPGRVQFREEFERIYAANKEDWSRRIGKSEQEKKIDSARRNLVIDGVVTLRELSDNELLKRIIDSAQMCDALDSLSLRREYNKFSSRIQLVFVRGPQPAIHVGSCRTSAFHFWAGVGVLELRDSGRVLPRIISQSSLNGQVSRGSTFSIPVEPRLFPVGLTFPEKVVGIVSH